MSESEHETAARQSGLNSVQPGGAGLSSPEDVMAAVERWAELYGGGDACAAEFLCDAHDPAATAFTLVDTDLNAVPLSYGELKDRSQRLAAYLAREHGIGEGSRVGVLLTKRAELPVTLIALARLGAVYIPLFTAFATGAIEMRTSASGARLIVTEPSQAAKTEGIEGVRTLVVGPEFRRAETETPPLEASARLGGNAPFLQLYTSGTTGKPKGVPVPVFAMAAFRAYLELSLEVTAEDVYWDAADPGWAYGLYYGVVAPLVCGRPNILYAGGFTPASTFAVIERLGVTNFAGAPTMYRAMSKASGMPRVALRRASSAGEPLTADVVQWAETALGTEVRDHYGQTELGMMICNHWHPAVRQPLKPSSMGRPLAGYAAEIRDGIIALDVPASPLFWFPGYLGEPEKTAERFSDDGRWYLTGDEGRRDDDGDFFFTAREDDLILSAGYRIGPFDVESVLITHPSVADVAVVGRPDPDGVRGELVEAFAVLVAGAEGTPELVRELQMLVRTQYSAHAYPRHVHFVPELPKTPSGKVQRFALRKAEQA